MHGKKHIIFSSWFTFKELSQIFTFKICLLLWQGKYIFFIDFYHGNSISLLEENNKCLQLSVIRLLRVDKILHISLNLTLTPSESKKKKQAYVQNTLIYPSLSKGDAEVNKLVSSFIFLFFNLSGIQL